MTKEGFIDSIGRTFSNGIELIKIKNADYANSEDPFKNFKLAEMVGVRPERAILVRVSDKLSRISNLLEKEADVPEEKISDTILDCINYLAILKAMLEDA